MTDPDTASAKLAATAKAVLDEAVDTAKDASAKIDDGTYGRTELLATLAKLTTTTVVGGLRLAETAMQNRQRRPTDGMLVLADHLASIAQRTVRHVRGVAQEAADNLAADPRRLSPWITAATKLTDIAVVNGIEAAQTAVIGPANYAPPTFVSDPFVLDVGAGNGQLDVVEPFRRPGCDEAVPRSRISFTPDALARDRREFRVLVNETGLPSGVYLGTVQAGKAGEPKTIALRL